MTSLELLPVTLKSQTWWGFQWHTLMDHLWLAWEGISLCFNTFLSYTFCIFLFFLLLFFFFTFLYFPILTYTFLYFPILSYTFLYFPMLAYTVVYTSIFFSTFLYTLEDCQDKDAKRSGQVWRRSTSSWTARSPSVHWSAKQTGLNSISYVSKHMDRNVQIQPGHSFPTDNVP